MSKPELLSLHEFLTVTPDTKADDIQAPPKDAGAAARAQRYRDKLRAEGKRPKGGKDYRTKAEHAAFKRRSRAAKKAAHYFVAVDSEGQNYGAPLPLEAKDAGEAVAMLLDGGVRHYQKHHTFLWGAARDGEAPHWLCDGDKEPLSTYAILDWLCGLSEVYDNAIFVMFAFSYDITQIVKGLPFEKAWELRKGLPYCERSKPANDPNKMKPNKRRIVFWEDFALTWGGGKSFTVGKLRDASKPRKDDKSRSVDYVSKPVTLFDVFGFFQSSFIEASKGMGAGFMSEKEFATIVHGKQKRGAFEVETLDMIKDYTTRELHVLARMMEKIRATLEAPDIDLSLRTWFGAGSVAQAAMKKSGITKHYPEISAMEPSEQQTWAHHAYFGGRIEMLQQGYHDGELHGYDIASAYPYIATQLPDMSEGHWDCFDADDLMSGDDHSPTRTPADIAALSKMLADWSLVSIVHVKAYFGNVRRDGVPFRFMPLPFRSKDGCIFFPYMTEGYYMVEEVRAMLDWCATMCDQYAPKIELKAAWRWTPADDAKPFAFIQEYFNKRAAITEQTKKDVKAWRDGGEVGPTPYDIREKVLKLAINSCYGKTAQGVGGRLARDPKATNKDAAPIMKPPTYANPFYAAAITAGTRAMLLRAALTRPDDIVMFATDGIIATKPLDIETTDEKILGVWEYERHKAGIFVKAGIYRYYSANERKPKITSKARGIKKDYLKSTDIYEEILQRWKSGERKLSYPYTLYKTVGAALASEKSWHLAGCWIDGERSCNLHEISIKRDCVADDAKRHLRLYPSQPAMNKRLGGFSAPHVPEWLDVVEGDIDEIFAATSELTARTQFMAVNEHSPEVWINEL